MAAMTGALKAFVVEVRTENGGYARYNEIARSSCDVLLHTLDRWGFANISVSPLRRR